MIETLRLIAQLVLVLSIFLFTAKGVDKVFDEIEGRLLLKGICPIKVKLILFGISAVYIVLTVFAVN